MRLLSYNILDGGLGRADPLAEVVLAQRADVVGLVEAGRPEVVERVARRLDADALAAPGPKRAAAVLTRRPILESVNHGLLLGDAGPRACVEATVETPAGGELPVIVLHLSSGRPADDEARRLEQIDAVLDAVARHRAAGTPHVVMGDFNSVSPRQQIDEARLRPKDLDGLRENGGDLPRDVVGRMESAGYVDAFAALHPDAAATAGTLDTIHAGLRVDYTFVWGLPPEKITAAWIETDRLAKYASDHYPVGIELDV